MTPTFGTRSKNEIETESDSGTDSAAGDVIKAINQSKKNSVKLGKLKFLETTR